MPDKVAIPFVLKKDYVQVTLPGTGAFSLDPSHPTFNQLRDAVKKGQWKKVPALVNLAQQVSIMSHGDVTVKKDGVYYKDKKAHDTLAERIIQLANAGKPVAHLIRFANNLYKNPSTEAVAEFYQWLVNNDLPITDNGCFLAYKSVRSNNTDTHTGKIDNSPGQVIMMARKDGDPNWRTQCSSGFHVCSKQYGTYGDKTMAVLINPRDVLSANSGKMRVVKYEVLSELGYRSDFSSKGFDQLEKKLVIEVKKERKEMITMLLGEPAVKKAIKSRKISKKSLLKSSFARLKAMVQRYNLVPSVGPEANESLKKARVAAGLTPGQVAKKMGVTLKSVYTLESSEGPRQDKIDAYLRAIADLVGIRDLSKSAISYPKPVKGLAAGV